MKSYLYLLLFSVCLLPSPSFAQQLTLEKLWETDPLFDKPESVVFDSVRQRLYVSNYHGLPKPDAVTDDFISILDLNGNVMEMKWITGLRAPTGLLIQSDSLVVVERDGISIFRIADGKRLHKQFIPNQDFLNDIASDGHGTYYFTNTSFRKPAESSIGKYTNGAVEIAYTDSIKRPNGILYEKDHLIIGNSGDASLKKIALNTHEISTLARFPKGIIDGIKRYDDTHLLVSLWQGQLFLVSDLGEMTELLDTRSQKIKIADFEFIPEREMLIIPTYPGKIVLAYKIHRD